MGSTVKIDLAKLREKISEYYKELDKRNGFAHEEVIQKKINECIIKEEAVQHPKHYQGKHECIEIMRHMFGDTAVRAFCKCNAFKYRFRSGMKNGEEDIKKAEWYEDYLINMDSDD